MNTPSQSLYRALNMNMRASVLAFCGYREQFALAQVSAYWRADPHLARIVRVINKMNETEDIVAVAESFGEVAAPAGWPYVAAAAFARASMNDIVAYFIGLSESGDRSNYMSCVYIAACLGGNIALIQKYAMYDWKYARLPEVGAMKEILMAIAVRELAPPTIIRAILRDISGVTTYGSFSGTIREIIEFARDFHTSATDFLDCAITRDIPGCIETMPHLCVDDMSGIDMSKRIEYTFENSTSAMSCVNLGPVLARELVCKQSTMHHIARQFPRFSPEFALYAETLDSAIIENWPRVNWHTSHGTIIRARVCANLYCAARNPDERAFEYVYEKLHAAQLIDRIDGVCTIAAWNNAEGINGLQRFMSRLQSKRIKVLFDCNSFWTHLHVTSLSERETIQCLEAILATGPDMRANTQHGKRAHQVLSRFAEFFGEPMREMLAKYHIVCD